MIRTVGRPKKGELAEVRKEANFTPTEWGEVLASLPHGAKPGTFIHDVVMRAVREPQSENADEVLQLFRVPVLADVPAGPWQEAIESATDFVLSSDVADELEAREGDVFVRAVGQSLKGAGIPDGAMVLTRQAVARPGEIAVVQAQTTDGKYWGTIKRWHPGQPPRLLDGDDKEFKLPPRLKTIEAVAVARGIVQPLGLMEVFNKARRDRCSTKIGKNRLHFLMAGCSTFWIWMCAVAAGIPINVIPRMVQSRSPISQHACVAWKSCSARIIFSHWFFHFRFYTSAFENGDFIDDCAFLTSYARRWTVRYLEENRQPLPLSRWAQPVVVECR